MNHSVKWRTALIAIFAATGLVTAHMGEDHDEHMAKMDSTMSNMAGMVHPSPTSSVDSAAKDTVMADFPTLHPLAVHFPIVLLPTGFVLLALGVGFRNSGLRLAGWGTASVGTVGAWVSSTLLHVHTMGLTSAPMAIFESHELWASRTVWIASVGVVTGLVRLVWKKPGVWLDGIGLGLFLAASVAVAVTGHKGACLTHLHGVGPMGHHLMME